MTSSHRLLNLLSIHPHMPLLITAVLLTCALSLQAQSSLVGSINRMRILSMKSEFESKPASYCRQVRNEVKPYIDAVNKALADTAHYNHKRDSLIQTLRAKEQNAHTDKERLAIGKQLYDQFINLNFETAYTMARQCEQWARQEGDKDGTAEAQIMQASAFANSGFFREASETLQQIKLDGCTKEVRIKYLMTAFNLEFENGFYTPYRILPHNTYLEHMQQYYGEMQKLVSADSYILDDMRVKMCFHQSKYDDAVSHSKILLAKLSPKSSYYGYALGNMGYNYMGAKQYVDAARCISQSAVLGIEEGSYTYPAMRKMAELAFIVNDIPHSYRMISVAMRNADFTHSRYRYAEIAASYPKIDKEMYAYTQRQKAWLTMGLVGLLAITVCLVVMVVVMLKQHKKLHWQKKLIEEQMGKLSDKSSQIEKINSELFEAGQVKEVVLGQLIVASANHQTALKKLRKEVLRRLTVKDYEGLRKVFESQNSEAFDAFYQLDQILLMLFPQFAEKFNALLRPDCQLTLKHGERLSTEMRIFALIRLGITKNDDIAQSLDYSVNTVKSYKTRVLNASLYTKEEFYLRLNKDIVANNEEDGKDSKNARREEENS